MDRAQRKSERLAEKRRRVGRRSHEMSVGEALDADTHEVDTTNLAGARREKQTTRVKSINKRKMKKQSNKKNKFYNKNRQRLTN